VEGIGRPAGCHEMRQLMRRGLGSPAAPMASIEQDAGANCIVVGVQPGNLRRQPPDVEPRPQIEF
jgi:hypothetical protein